MKAALLACPPTARASLVELWSRNGSGRGGAAGLSGPSVGHEALRAVVPDGTPVEAALLFWWSCRCPGRPPLLSRDAAARLRRHAGQLDRLNGPGAGLTELALAMAHIFAGVDHGAGADVHTAAYAIRPVKLAARDAVRRDRAQRGVRANGRGRSGPQIGTWRSRRGESEC